MNELPAFATALAFLIGGIVFVIAGMLVAYFIAPNRPNAEKLSSYECGEEPVGTAWGQFNFRFYVMGLIFLIFDVEILLLFPWATVFADPKLIALAPAWGIVNLVEVGIFAGILLLGLAYIWNRKAIDWSRPKTIPPTVSTAIPSAEYIALNERLSKQETNG
jgi:NADH-quinone oxidoreductase subunit A